MANRKHIAMVTDRSPEIWEWRVHNSTGLDLTAADLSGLDLSGLDLSKAKLNDADLRQADLSRAMLLGANLSRARLDRANLSGAMLDAASLAGADLSGAALRRAHLLKADLLRAQLHGTNFRFANLRGANFRQADLSWANFTGAKVDEARFDYAQCEGAVFGDMDLSATIGLETIQHLGPSTIGVDTMFQSRGILDEQFLRGCGVPGNMITYLRSLTGQALEFYSCFISYSHADEDFARRVYSRLRDEGLRVWYAPEDMKGGERIHDQIDRAIRIHDKVLLVLSEASMSSDWVAEEIHIARQREREDGHQVLFPIRIVPFERIQKWKCFDTDTGKDMAREIREYFIPDFVNWKDHDQFEVTFRVLLRDLRASQQQAGGA